MAQDTQEPQGRDGIVDSLARMARIGGCSVPRPALEGLALRVEALYAELDRLLALPLAGVEPAFVPRLRDAADEGPPAP